MKAQSEQIDAAFKLRYASSDFSLDVSINLPAKGVTAIFGASGSGKTSLMRCMTGLEKAQGGRLVIGDQIWQDEKLFLPVQSRPQGVVFQDATLFEHLSVKGNLEYGLKRARSLSSEHKAGSSNDLSKGLSSGQRHVIGYDEVIDLLDIRGLLRQMPATLSGGEKQRVAVARALLRQPRILFMDEPLSALDYQRKQEVLPYLENLSQACNIPIIYITHSLDEVAKLADYIVLMDNGQVVADGPLKEVLARVDLPISLANELGVVLTAKVVEKDTKWHLGLMRFDGGELWLKDNHLDIGSSLRVRILAKDVSLSLVPQDSSILNSLPAVVIEVVNDEDDAMSLVRLTVRESILIARITRRSVDHLRLCSGQAVWAHIKSVAILP